jgi:hypothetical protein
VKKKRREHIFVEEGISQVGSDRNTREHNRLWKKKRLREHNHYGKFHMYSGSGERQRVLGFGARVLVCSSVLAASCFFPAVCIAGAAEDGVEDR